MTTIAADCLTRDELKTLHAKLDTISDIELRAAIALTPRLAAANAQPPDLAGTRAQPRSRPPYPLHLNEMLERLYNELATTARHMCEHRGLDYAGGVSCAAVAKWIDDYRQSLASMPDGIELYDNLIRHLDIAAKALNRHDEDRHISQAMVEAANRSVVTVGTIEGIARQLGDSGKGLTRERMQTLIRASGLTETSTDKGTGTKFYRLGDVLFFHKTHKRRARRSA